MLKSVVGQDFILRPIFNRPSRSRFPQWFMAPGTFPTGIVPRSCVRVARQRHERKTVPSGTSLAPQPFAVRAMVAGMLVAHASSKTP